MEVSSTERIYLFEGQENLIPIISAGPQWRNLAPSLIAMWKRSWHGWRESKCVEQEKKEGFCFSGVAILTAIWTAIWQSKFKLKERELITWMRSICRISDVMRWRGGWAGWTDKRRGQWRSRAGQETNDFSAETYNQSQVCKFFSCCTADSQADEDWNTLNNNMKID